MKVIMTILFAVSFICMPASALEINVPAVPDSGLNFMPENTESFSEGILQILSKVWENMHPTYVDALNLCISIVCAVFVVSVFHGLGYANSHLLGIVGSIVIASFFISDSKSMIQLASDTIHELTDYGKLLIPVMTTAMAAQGGIASSHTLHIGTVFFNTILGSILSALFIPAVYFYLVFSVAGAALEDSTLKNFGCTIRKSITWCLKTLLIIFTTYMSITGVITGATDIAALKAAKVTISSVVPVVGGILSDSSEAILVSAGLIKNAAGVYGILAVLAVCAGPFLQIGIHYLLLRITAVLCSFWGEKNQIGLIEDFSVALGLLLAMTGSVCLLLLVSIVCFLKGMN